MKVYCKTPTGTKEDTMQKARKKTKSCNTQKQYDSGTVWVILYRKNESCVQYCSIDCSLADADCCTVLKAKAPDSMPSAAQAKIHCQEYHKLCASPHPSHDNGEGLLPLGSEPTGQMFLIGCIFAAQLWRRSSTPH